MVRSNGTQHDGLGTGMICSALLHGLAVILALFGLPHLLTKPPEISEPVVVDIETIAEHSNPPPKNQEEQKPEEKPPEPKQETPPPPPPTPAPTVAPEPEPVPVPKPTPAPPKPTPSPTPAPTPPPNLLRDIKPPPKKPPPPPDDFDNLLKSVDKLRQDSPKPTNAPAPAPKSNSPAPSLASQPTSSEKDYISGQIWPKWNVDLGAKGASTLQVRVLITVQPSGQITSARLDVDRGRYEGDNFYRAAADAALRAVLASSPLKSPSTRPDIFRENPDMTIEFDPRRMVR